jgi:hypothetical protein
LFLSKYIPKMIRAVFILSCIYSFCISCNTGKVVNLPAEVTLDRPHYQLKYYSDWTIDSTDANFDIDSYFTFNTASDNGTISFFIFNTPIDPEEHVNGQVEAHLDGLLKGGKVEYFQAWGKFKGQGAVITGKLMGVMKGEVKIFAYAGDTYSFLAVSQIFESDQDKDLPGLKLIENTFMLR